MPARGHRKLFEQLGLLAETEPPNPLAALGIHPELAGQLLGEDPSGDALRVVATGLFRILSRRYHADVSGTGNPERFRQVDTAKDQIAGATLETLSRWIKSASETSPSRQSQHLQERQLAFVDRAAMLVRKNMELGSHPHHFSQSRWSQGILLRRRGKVLLLREQPEGPAQAIAGRRFDGNAELAASDFQAFMSEHASFGLEPGTKIATYIDQHGRASILSPTLDFMMDITHPVAAWGGTSDIPPEQRLWARSTNPLLLVTHTPGAKETPTHLTGFLQQTHNMTWELPLEVTGTVANKNFFKRTKSKETVGAVALGSGQYGTTANHFSLSSVSVEEIIAQDAGYSPLITPGNALLLYDTHNSVPIATDALVIGMIGNGAQAV